MKKSFALCLFVLLLTLCACGKTAQPSAEPSSETSLQTTVPAPRYVFEEASGARIIEPMGHALLFPNGMLQTEVDGCVYQFSPEIAESEREEFIDAQEQLRAHLKQNDIDLSGYTFRILQELMCRSDSENKTAYFGMNSLARCEQALVSVQSYMGDCTNYGYLYGLSCHICEALGWEYDSGKENPQSFKRSPELLHLVYPCFSEQFTEPKDVSACMALARTVFAEVKRPYGGERGFFAALDAYTKEQELEYEAVDYGFAYDGSDYPLRVESWYTTLRIEQAVSFEKGEVLKDLLDALQYVDYTIYGYCQELRFEPEKNIEVNLRAEQLKFENSTPEGIFSPGRASKVSSIYAIPKIYIYFYMYETGNYTGQEEWQAWCLTGYLQRAETLAYYITDKSMSNYAEWALGRPLERPTDLYAIEHVFVHSLLPTSPKNRLYNYGTISFAGYFVENYGSDAFVGAMLDKKKCYSLTGKSLDSIVQDWCEFIKNDVVAPEKEFNDSSL